MKLRLEDIYLHRADNIGKFSYGIYAKNRMFYMDEQINIVPVHHLAQKRGIDLLAERFALERGRRSARLARQFIDGLLSR